MPWQRVLATVGCIAALLAGGCGKEKAGSAALEEAPTDDQGRTVGAIDAAATGVQEVTVSGDGELAGAGIEFGPGTLAISTDVAIEAGLPVATESVATTLGISGASTAGPAVVFSAAEEQDALTPFSVSLPLSEASALTLAGDLIVVYKIKKVADGKLYVGSFPTDKLTVEDGFVRFQATYFGAYQVAYATERGPGEDVETTVPIATKQKLPTVRFVEASASVDESGGSTQIQIELSHPLDDVASVSYTLSGTASSEDHGLVAGSFVLPAGTVEQSLSFRITDDDDAESPETVVLTLLASGNAKPGEQGVFTLTIADDD